MSTRFGQRGRGNGFNLRENAGTIAAVALAVAAAGFVMGAVGVVGFVLSLAYTGTCNGTAVCDLVSDIQSTIAGTAAMNAMSPLNTLGTPFILPNASDPTQMYTLNAASIEINPMYSSAVEVTGNGYLLHSTDTSGLAQVDGQFNGAGAGNKIFVGLRQACGQPLSSLQEVDIGAFTRRGVDSFVFVNILVDVEGDGTFDEGGDDCIVYVTQLTDPRLELPVDGSSQSILLTPDLSVFTAAQSKCGLPAANGAVGAPLANVSITFPNATIYCGEMTNVRYPVATPMAGIQYIQADSTEYGFRESMLTAFMAKFV